MGWLRNFHFTDEDLGSLQVDDSGAIFYADDFRVEGAPEAASAEPVTMGAAVPVSPFPGSLVFHSRPGAPNVLYLDFDGETVTGTAWNTSEGRLSIPAVSFSTDSDHSTFSDSEQLAIRRVWQRVAEDYAPFNIDVTTERPASFNNRTAHALITRSTDQNGDPNPSSQGGGVAYVNVFGQSNYATYRPAWIYSNNLGGNDAYIAEAASHEIGHNLGLSHDGLSGGTEYYSGHGSGDTSWGPVMGSAYNKNVSQWSKGDYYNANNTQDDVATIAGKISYRTDDHGNSFAAPTPLLILEGGQVQSTNPQTDPGNNSPENKGVIESKDDVDAFSFVTGAGPVNLTISPWVVASSTIKGGNVDLVVELYNEGGALLLSNNGSSVTYAQINTSLAEGMYYLLIRSTGAGTPSSSSPSGYTSYASMGQYFISGSVVPSNLVIPRATLNVTDVTAPGAGAKQFTVTYSDNTSIDVSTISSGDVIVAGPNGYSSSGTLISVDQPSDGTPRIATYQIAPAGATWTTSDNGVYTISMQANQVNDTEGDFVPAGVLGTFNVAVPEVIYSADMSSNPGWTLQPLWQYGSPFYLLGGGPSQGYTGNNVIGYNLSGDYESRLSPVYATTPAINCSNAGGMTLRFERWLRLRSGDTAAIQFSTDGSIWTDLWMTSETVSDNGWQLVEYPLPPSVDGTPSLRFRWVMASGPNQNDIGWHLDDVQLVGYRDTTAPSAVLAVTDLTSGGSASHNCTVTYTDNNAVDLSSLDSNDLLVAGPNGYSAPAQFVSATLSSDGTPLTATYSIAAPGGNWDAADDGTYQIALAANQVEDVYGNAAAGGTLGSFTVFLTTPGQLAVLPAGGLNAGGVVGGPFAPSNQSYTLTNSGGMTLDWSASKTTAWVTLSSTSGTLAAGQATTVTVSINSAANNLNPGGYSDTVSFANTTTGNGNTSRTVSLTVNSQGLLAVSGSGGLAATGSAGGPFAPSSVTYTLSNSGGSTLNWSASKTAAWVTLSAASGSLAPGASANVTVSINSSANGLNPGSYSDTVTFANTTTGNGNTTRPVSLTVNSHGMLGVTGSGGLTASGTEGGPFTPSSITYTLTNSGGSSLNWTASKTGAWVTLSATSGSLAPGGSASVIVSINGMANGLNPGNHSDTITFANTSTGNGDTTRPVSLTVNSHGMLGVIAATDLIASGTQGGPFSPGSQVYTLTNSGGSTLNWSASKTAAWLTLSSTSGALATNASATVTVSINAGANTLDPGAYSDTVSFANTTTGSGNTSRPVSLTVNSYGLLGVTAATDLDASGTEGGPFTPSSNVYTLTNSGQTDLQWSATKTAPWLTLSSTSGTLAPSESTTVTVTINSAADNLSPGEYTDNIAFANSSGGSGNTSRPVSLSVLTQGVLAVTTPADLTSTGAQGGPFTPSSTTYTLTNAGESSLSWTVSKTASWITLSASSGTLAPSESASVTASINAEANNLNPGSYSDTLIFSNTTTGNGEMSSPVSLTVNSHGNLGVTSTAGLTASGTEGGPFTPESVTYTLTNSGGSSLNWTITKSAAWLTLSSGSGNLASGQSTSVTVSINSAANTLSPGEYNDTVMFANTTTGTGDTSRPISLTVKSPGSLVVTTSTGLSASGTEGGPFTPESVTYTVTNSGGTALGWTAAKSASWLTLSQSGGTLQPNETATVSLSINSGADDLPSGSYSDSLVFSDTTNGGEITHPVSLEVKSAGILALVDPADLQASGVLGGPFAPDTQAYVLTNSGGATLDWEVSGSAAWLTLSASSGTLSPGESTNVTVSLTPEAEALNPGTYYASITFQNTTASAANPPTQSASISRTAILDVLDPGWLEVTPADSFAASGHAGGAVLPAQKIYTVTNPGETEIGWTASSPAPWVELSPSGGSLLPGESAEVTVQITEAAAALPIGTTLTSITFTEYDTSASLSFNCEVTIYDLPALDTPTITAGSLNIEFSGIPGRSYLLEASSDLQTWVSLGAVVAAPDGLVQFTDAEAASEPYRFYRTQVAP